MDLPEPAYTHRHPPPSLMENDGQLPEYEGQGHEQDRDARLQEGLYILRNKRARTVLDLWSQEEIECHGVTLNTNVSIGNQLWLLQHSDANGTYTLKNLSWSKYLEAKAGQKLSKVIPRARDLGDSNRLNQEWRIEEQEPGEYTLKCAGTNTFLEIAKGNPADCVEVSCSEAAPQMDHQLWILTRASRTGSEIKALLESWKPDIGPKIIQPHPTPTEYFVLPHEVRQSLWKESKLPQRLVRPGLFDYNEFVIKSKETIGAWARDKYPVEVQGVSVLFGIIYGEPKKGPKAYNWYLTADMCSLVFFDAQIGQEYSPAALDGLDFKPTFVTF